VLIYPARVQGAAAAPSLVQALRLASARRECDVLILARGGGSLEDLWAFNDERVARAIHACTIPVVAGVGHEVDVTIADFVADARAPTPSGAAEHVTPDRVACLEALAKTANRLSLAARRELRSLGAHLDAVSARLQQAHPGMRVLQQIQRLDDLQQRMSGAAQAGLHRRRSELADALARLLQHSPERRVRAYAQHHGALQSRLEHAAHAALAHTAHRLDLAARALDAVSPLATLARGFAIVTRADGSLVRAADSVAVGEQIEARLAEGRLTARVTGKQ